MKEQKIQFDSEFEMEGLFWLSEDQSKQLSGVLSYSPQSGIEVKITGVSEKNDLKENYRYYEVIYGDLQSGFKVSLFECRMSRLHLVTPDFTNDSIFFNVSTAFFTFSKFCAPRSGKYLEGKKTSDLKFKKMTLYFTHLEEWLSFPHVFDQKDEAALLWSIPRNHPQENSDDDYEEYKLTFKHPKMPSFKISIDDIETEISLLSKVEAYDKGRYHRCFMRYCSLNLSCNTKKPYDWFLSVSKKLENFLSLLIDTEVRCLRFWLFTNDKENKRISVLRQRPYFEYDKKFYSTQMIVLYESIEKEFKKILESWFKKYDELQEALDWFFLVKNNNELFVKTKFLHLVQALEVFHQKTDSSGYLPEEDFEKLKCKIIKKIEDDLPEDVEGFKESFRNKLGYGNELSLRKRFKKIVSSIDKDLYPCSFSKEKVSLSDLLFKEKDIIDDIVDIRNKLIHGGSEEDHLETEKIDCYNIKLSILLSYSILIEIGMPKNLVSKGFVIEKGFI